MSVPKPQPVFILSDGTGITGEKVVRAAFRQFKGHLVHLKVFPHVTQTEELTGLFRKARRVKALVVTTLVTRDMRIAAERLAADMGVRHLDLLGHLIHELEGFLDQESVGVPGTLHTTDDSYFRRIEAVEFTVKLDDGKLPRMLNQADIILVGVSRTSKTPLSTFLAHKGFKVANVPIVLDRPPPNELFHVDQDRVFALTIDPDILQEIRLSRLEALGMGPQTNYGDRDYILAEIEYADDLYAGNPEWPVINVTNKAVEETAATILRIFQDRGHAVPLGEVSQL
ncbi:MAG: kinase/pyrophosphorylase [Deltaproteobacteria bacterium]|nr:MAG: kinase/pyrophosphorylase [Deltaproteobacteria bacterium]